MIIRSKKLSQNLDYITSQNLFTEYRVVIEINSLMDSVIKKINSLRGKIIRIIPSLNIISAEVSNKCITRLLELPSVKYITIDDIALLSGVGVYSSNKLSFKSSLPSSGRGVTIAVIDSGVYPHNDLIKPNNRIKKFQDLVSGLSYPYDDNGHGTLVSGMLCGSGIDSKQMYKGIAYEASLYMVKAFDAVGRGFISDILYGIETIITSCEDYNIRVLCLPFESLSFDGIINNLFYKAFNLCKEKKIIVIVPSGNNNAKENSIRGISILDNCITVGGIDTTSHNAIYPYSATGNNKTLKKPDFLAACVEVTSLNTNRSYISERNGVKLFPHKLDHPYISFSGTSAAAAYVAGLCALVCEMKPSLDCSDIYSLLILSSRKLEDLEVYQGHGIIDTKILFSNLKE